ncbi:Os09g0380100 [Oryza sativa Japonica Group]|uniref:Os09g0380100 protein n=5 Tax=Oryza TaxID=4527 RepID=A0A0N7KQQ1_ORYSJ|nr:hypothetical protein OsI_31180 [Oryza sativa Indica Group]EAZ44563.1 hypothetical protein OsJ_29183 [Oryza sativa Japonica Group]KAF2915969.1 hypothetical protein DAI22_09g081800 [Oryza sativa Japonica Group]BAD26088.1 hypothetical protein [Oryza sativa Japonica Group]BAT07842.1 Os09g0380100 [Oryza sativa Japonica Group]
MGKLAKLVGGIKARLRRRKMLTAAAAESSSSSSCYDKMEKTNSMKVEITSRRAQKLIAKNLAIVDAMVAGSNSNNSSKAKKRAFFP